MSLSKAYERLKHIARHSILHGIDHQCALPVALDGLDGLEPTLQQERASFVSLHLNHTLRGCMGMLTAQRALALDVSENAFSAAFRDPRFNPVSASEVSGLKIHISILSDMTPIACSSEEDLLRELRPHTDGLMLREHAHKSTFLPQVWTHLPTPRDFLHALKQKAGLAADYWSDTIEVMRYTVEDIEE